jgi:hypothetical protein
MENPNEYNEDDWNKANSGLDGAIQEMWNAGASTSEIEEAITNGFGNCDLDADVSIGVAPANPRPEGGGPKRGRA